VFASKWYLRDKRRDFGRLEMGHLKDKDLIMCCKLHHTNSVSALPLSPPLPPSLT